MVLVNFDCGRIVVVAVAAAVTLQSICIETIVAAKVLYILPVEHSSNLTLEPLLHARVGMH